MSPAFALAIIPGNGLIIDDIARDIVCNNHQCLSHAVSTAKKGYDVDDRVIYLFPKFAAIVSLENIYQPISTLSDCHQTHQNTYLLRYQAEPTISRTRIYNPKFLGTCIPGQKVTRVYKQLFKTASETIILPMFSMDRMDPDTLNQASEQTLRLLAIRIAFVINNDTNADGLSFDTRDLDLSAKLIWHFFSPLAEALKKQDKRIALISNNTRALKKLQQRHGNIVALISLNSVTHQTNYFPISLNNYTNETHRLVKHYLHHFGVDIPVIFVIPGSASPKLYQRLALYNTHWQQALHYPLTRHRTLISRPCSKSLVDNVLPVIERLLYLDLSSYLNQCDEFRQHQNAMMQRYLRTALHVIRHAFKSHRKARRFFIGVAFSPTKVPGFYAIQCAKIAPFTFHDPSLQKACLGLYPESTNLKQWQYLNRWQAF